MRTSMFAGLKGEGLRNAAIINNPVVTPTEEFIAAAVSAPMDAYRACSIAEGFTDEEYDEGIWQEAWQHLIDTGLCWRLQGWYGRTAQQLIEDGVCTAPQ